MHPGFVTAGETRPPCLGHHEPGSPDRDIRQVRRRLRPLRDSLPAREEPGRRLLPAERPGAASHSFPPSDPSPTAPMRKP